MFIPAAATPTPVALTVATTKLNPLSTDKDRHVPQPQSNLMVMKPGGYSTATFVRFGIPPILVVFQVGWGLLALR